MNGGQNYDFIQVDPRVIKMLGGDDTVEDSTFRGDLDADISPTMLESFDNKNFGTNGQRSNNFNQMALNEAKSDDQVALLRQILQELKNIETMISGK